MMLDRLLVWLADFGDFAARELASRALWEWILLFAPLLFLLEVPRYYLPLFGLLLTRRRRAREPRGTLAADHADGPPLVSVVVAGRNEGASIDAAVRTLLGQDYPRLEVLVCDDASTDATLRIAHRYAAEGRIRLIRNEAPRGRGGKPSALNMGLRMARGSILLSVDADTRFDRDMVARTVEPFRDPRVGAVAGNVVPRRAKGLLVRLQVLEYLLGIDLYKRWTSRLGSTLQASGALAAFRTDVLREVGGWDPELAEDTDVSLRVIKAGWRVAFAPAAVAWTDVPTKALALVRQRERWDRGGWRTFARKHARLLWPRAAGPAVACELAFEILFFAGSTVAVPAYLTWLAFQGAFPFLFVALLTYGAHAVLALGLVVVLRLVSENAPPPEKLLVPALLLPLYKEALRWVRARALLAEVLGLGMEHSFLPTSAWAHKPRF